MRLVLSIPLGFLLSLLLGAWFLGRDEGSTGGGTVGAAPHSASQESTRPADRHGAELIPFEDPMGNGKPEAKAPTAEPDNPVAEGSGEEWRYPPTEIAPDDGVVLAELGLPVDTPLSPRVTRGGPPDPLEPGDASLNLQLVNGANGKPCSSSVVLWRLAAPGNAIWTPGDQDVAAVYVRREGHRFGPIAAGEYRIVCAEEGAKAPQQSPFLVAGETNIEVRLIHPKARRALLVPGPGQEASNGVIQAQFRPVRSKRVEWQKPDWVQPRSIRPDFPWNYLEMKMPICTGAKTDSRWFLLAETQEGHELGELAGDSRHCRYTQSVELRKDGDPWGAVRLANTAPGPRLFVQYPK